MPTSACWAVANSPKITVKTVYPARSDVGIGPYGPIIRKPTGGAEPRPYNLPRKKVTPIKISVAPSIDSKNSTATSYKFDTPVSGGAYQDARKVTIEWNDA